MYNASKAKKNYQWLLLFTLSMYNVLHRSLQEELRECKIDLEAKGKEIESLMGR